MSFQWIYRVGIATTKRMQVASSPQLQLPVVQLLPLLNINPIPQFLYRITFHFDCVLKLSAVVFDNLL